jgi:hypothetical protein
MTKLTRSRVIQGLGYSNAVASKMDASRYLIPNRGVWHNSDEPLAPFLAISNSVCSILAAFVSNPGAYMHISFGSTAQPYLQFLQWFWT